MRYIGINKATGGKQLQGAGVLLSIGTQILKLKNAKETPYRLCTARVTTSSGESKVFNCLMYESNFQKGGFKIGDSLSLRAELTPGQANPLLVLSHLHAGERATMSDFDFGDPGDVVAATQTVAAGTIRETVGEEA